MTTDPNISRRRITQAIALTLAISGGSAMAQAWPSRPISLIVPFPAGGTTDVLARALAQPLAQVLGQPVVVESKPGAGATIGANFVAKANPDGYTLLMGAVHHTIATSVYKKLTYDFAKDLAPVTTVALVPNVLVVNASTSAKTVAELVKMIKAEPGKFAYGSNGNGTAQHLIGTQFQSVTGTQLIHTPYRGSAPLTTDLLGGQILMSFDTVTPVLPHIKAGKLRALAVTTAKRSAALPDVPTLEEAGMKDFNIGTWFGVLAPAATPKEIVNRLNTEIVKIIQSPEFRARMADIGAEPIGDTSEQMAKQIASETAKFSVLVKEAKIEVE
ncbi:MAG: tripartite tricarboxylate transporter substrate binding protein [Hydrogenophaga sp.]|uniref:Bug family tripartite tricarboxylate transporter substrate binding protein n=1 Tax=Hydrogenophaga sp. TaxID=1904254 RepID=UPI002AB95059|nr:tripartite tricarboxylate transporter substrate binding protein [Hydrogenophaga sp.]MDZ4188183.1 tripartite tricarboxylate transporter substrate binding protein [Hydrogenophaga sp.]